MPRQGVGLAAMQKTHEEQLVHQMEAMVRATNELATVKGEHESQRAGCMESSVSITREPGIQFIANGINFHKTEIKAPPTAPHFKVRRFLKFVR